MKFLKKPIFIKKIRSYNDGIKLSSFFLNVQPNFVKQNDILKSSYVEKILDLNKESSGVRLKGGYVYRTLHVDNGNPFISINSGILSAINPNEMGSGYCSDKNVFLARVFKNYFNIINHRKYSLVAYFLKFNKKYDI